MEQNREGPPKLKPFLKWAGGKRALLDQILPELSLSGGSYFEPFLGAGAVLLALPRETPKFASDSNGELINAWSVVRDAPSELIQTLEGFDHSKATFLKVRALDRSASWLANASNVERAARTIYLNRTCFNGLYRVNSKGQFNVPFGSYKRPDFVNRQNIHAVSDFLSAREGQPAMVTFSNTDFAEAVKTASTGDTVYFDPPYAPVSETSSFVSYTSAGFGSSDQERLRDLSVELVRRGVRVLISNACVESIETLYSGLKGFSMRVVRAPRPIAASGKNRASVGEFLISGMPK